MVPCAVQALVPPREHDAAVTGSSPQMPLGAGGVRRKNRHPMDRATVPHENKFHVGNGDDGKHYWLTPPVLRAELQAEFNFDFDACPFPKPADFDGLTCEWGKSSYANIPFGSVIGHDGKKKGPTAWARKAIAESRKGKRVVLLYPIDKWVLMMLAAGAQVRNLGDIRWCATEDGSPGKGTGRHIAAFILEPGGGGGFETVATEPAAAGGPGNLEREARGNGGFSDGGGSSEL